MPATCLPVRSTGIKVESGVGELAREGVPAPVAVLRHIFQRCLEKQLPCITSEPQSPGRGSGIAPGNIFTGWSGAPQLSPCSIFSLIAAAQVGSSSIQRSVESAIVAAEDAKSQRRADSEFCATLHSRDWRTASGADEENFVRRRGAACSADL
eukprot:scaffold7789_cov200-Pinguiococcus_pyrenoidosus.AAC.2